MKKSTIILFLVKLALFVTLDKSGFASSPADHTELKSPDTLYSSSIKHLLENKRLPGLAFPVLITKFYRNIGFKSVWMGPADNNRLWETIDILNCVKQYGLNKSDYHEQDLTYTNLNLLALHSAQHKAKMDILVTDAMLLFIAHLHFGKVNPGQTIANIDKPEFKGFRIDSALSSLLNTGGLRKGISRVQPQTEAYVNLQNYLKLAVAQYNAESEDLPEKTFQLISLNLERLRWENLAGKTYVAVNIPAFNLRYFDQNEYSREFRVIVGKLSNPTPVLQSKIFEIVTAPDWNVPRKIFVKELLPKAIKNPGYLEDNHFLIYDRKGNVIHPSPARLKIIRSHSHLYRARQSPGCENALGRVKFNFNNPYSVYLHDTPDHSLFLKEVRTFSHGCIRVDDSEELARMLLLKDGASSQQLKNLKYGMENYKRHHIYFKKPVPIIVRYLTCEIRDGYLLTYPDVYNFDPIISDAIFTRQ